MLEAPHRVHACRFNSGMSFGACASNGALRFQSDRNAAGQASRPRLDTRPRPNCVFRPGDDKLPPPGRNMQSERGRLRAGAGPVESDICIGRCAAASDDCGRVVKSRPLICHELASSAHTHAHPTPTSLGEDSGRAVACASIGCRQGRWRGAVATSRSESNALHPHKHHGRIAPSHMSTCMCAHMHVFVRIGRACMVAQHSPTDVVRLHVFARRRHTCMVALQLRSAHTGCTGKCREQPVLGNIDRGTRESTPPRNAMRPKKAEYCLAHMRSPQNNTNSTYVSRCFTHRLTID